MQIPKLWMNHGNRDIHGSVVAKSQGVNSDDSG